MLLPLFALACLSFVVVLTLLVQRIRAVRRGDVSPRYYQKMQGEAPEYILTPAKNLANLFEMPVLFYAAGILAIVLNLETPAMVGLAWAYVALRAAHTVIHLTYNHVLHRLAAFFVSNICLTAMWALLLIRP